MSGSGSEAGKATTEQQAWVATAGVGESTYMPVLLTQTIMSKYGIRTPRARTDGDRVSFALASCHQ